MLRQFGRLVRVPDPGEEPGLSCEKMQCLFARMLQFRRADNTLSSCSSSLCNRVA